MQSNIRRMDFTLLPRTCPNARSGEQISGAIDRLDESWVLRVAAQSAARPRNAHAYTAVRGQEI